MEVLGIGYQEILLVAALIVIVVGPRRLPEMAYYLGRGVKKLQRYARVVRDEFSEEFSYLNEEMEAVRADMREVRATVTEVRDELADVRGEVEGVTSEAVSELGVVRTGIEQGGARATGQDSSRETARNGAAAETGANGAAPARGVSGPSYIPPIAKLEEGEKPEAPEARAEGEVEDESGAKPEKPLVF